MLATTIDTIRDLGVPGLVGAVVGALIAHFTAKARGREEHQRTLDVLVTQDERRAAQSALDAARAIRTRVNSGDRTYGQMHNSWQDTVLAPSRLIRSEDLESRISALGTVLFFAASAPEQNAAHAVLRGALDVEEWLEAWLRREQPPIALLPSSEDLRRGLLDRGRISFDSLTDFMQNIR